MSRVVSVRHRAPLPHSQQTKRELLQTCEMLQKKEGFLHYRLLESAGKGMVYTLITFWQSNQAYRRAMRSLSVG